tara:strand:+ start:34 stop:516 length:483 start_codon:yes stop_codon:yes gene_type:complete
MNIYKNFISKKDCNIINKYFLSNTFPWYYISKQCDYGKKDTPFLSHTFFKNEQVGSSDMFLIKSIIKKLKIKKLLNVRANLCLKGESKCSWHVDNFTDNLKHTTAIYYVNTNNGYTEFKNKKIKCEKNKIIIFNADKKHRAVGQTDTQTRMVINFNYEYI